MFSSLEHLSRESKVWVYVSNSALLSSVVDSIEKDGQSFLQQWTAHQFPIQGGFYIFKNQILILVAKPEGAIPSGCAIDASLHFIQTLESKYEIILTDRSKIAFINNQGEFLVNDYKQVIQEIKDQTFDLNAQILDVSVSTLRSLLENGFMPIDLSWLKKYIPLTSTLGISKN